MNDRQCGRFWMTVYSDGSGISLKHRNGWNDHCEMLRLSLVAEDLYDLRHLVDRAIAQIEGKSK